MLFQRTQVIRNDRQFTVLYFLRCLLGHVVRLYLSSVQGYGFCGFIYQPPNLIITFSSTILLTCGDMLRQFFRIILINFRSFTNLQIISFVLKPVQKRCIFGLRLWYDFGFFISNIYSIHGLGNALLKIFGWKCIAFPPQ